MDTLFRQKNNKEMLDLKHTSDQMHLPHIYRILPPIAPDYTFSSSIYETFLGTDNMRGHKKSLSKFKEIEIMPGIFSYQHSMK